MDFFHHQERARRKTKLLLFYFAVAIVGIVLSVYLPIALLLGGPADPRAPGVSFWDPSLLALVAGGVLATVGLGSTVRFVQLASGGATVAEALGGRLLRADTTDLVERKILNVVEEMAIASGIPTPDVYLLEHEPGINAFAAGLTSSNAVIGVTRGCVELLNRDQLQGVVAHEFSHILNGDMRLNLRLVGLISGILALAIIGRILLRATAYSSSGSSSRKGANPLPLIGLLLILVGYVGVIFAKLIRSAISRQREFLADASAVQFTRNPDGIAGALKKIGALAAGSRLASPNAEEASHMFFGNGIAQPLLGLFATHPPLERRIRAIDPSFDGDFTRESTRPRTSPPPPPPRPAAPGSFPSIVGQPNLGPAIAAALAALPAQIAESAHQPLAAATLVLSLTMARDEEIRGRQSELVTAIMGREFADELARILPLALDTHPRHRLPLVDRAMPALRGLSPRQYEKFRECLDALVAADSEIDAFELSLQQLLQHHLDTYFGKARPPRVAHRSIETILPAIHALLATLAHRGAPAPEAARAAFARGLAALSPADDFPDPIPLPDRPEPAQFAGALATIARATPQLKRATLHACAETALADRTVTDEERELLRAIAENLDCPIPPLET